MYAFPSQPADTTYDLAWTVNRLTERIATMPDPSDLTLIERNVLATWLGDFREDLRAAQHDETALVDPLAVVGIVSLLIGVSAAPLIPVLTIGAFIVSSGLLGQAVIANHDGQTRKRFARKIDGLLRDMIRRLR